MSYGPRTVTGSAPQKLLGMWVWGITLKVICPQHTWLAAAGFRRTVFTLGRGCIFFHLGQSHWGAIAGMHLASTRNHTQPGEGFRISKCCDMSLMLWYQIASAELALAECGKIICQKADGNKWRMFFKCIMGHLFCRTALVKLLPNRCRWVNHFWTLVFKSHS